MKQSAIPAVDLQQQYDSLREEIETAVRGVFERQDFILGAEVQQLEREMARRHDCSHAVGCASGSDALLLSLMALGIGPGDVVVVPAFTFFATAGAPALLGARPHFVDIEPRTFHLSLPAVERALQEDVARRIKAIIPVHLYGQCADMDGVTTLANATGVVVVEDAAQAVLARWGGRAAGSFGKTGCFSFYPTKNLSGAGDGGMITTRDATLAEKLRLLRNHGSADKQRFGLLGRNSRLDTVQAAVLLVKLRYLEQWTQQRVKRAEFYRQALAAAGVVSSDAVYPTQDAPIILPQEAPNAGHVYHQFTIRALRRDQLAEYLQEAGIGATVYYAVPLHRQPVFTAQGPQPDCPEADRAAAEVLSLPLYPELTEAQQLFVVEQIKKFYSSRG